MKFSDCFSKMMLVAGGCLITATVFAQDEGEGLVTLGEVEKAPTLYTNNVEIGAGYVSEDSYKFGEYNGLQEKGGFAIANILLRKYLAPDRSDTNYWIVDAKNLGLDNRSVSAEYGQIRSFRLMFKYDSIPHYRFNDGRTPFIGAGTADQTLPSTWVGADSTSGLTDLFPSLRPVDVHTDRKRYGGGFIWDVTDRWKLNASFRHERKDGTDTLGAVFGSNGGNPRSSILVRPIDYETNNFSTSVAYTGERGQYSLSYNLSLFNNNDNALLWDNPFNNSQWDTGANFSDGARGRMSSEPDNEAWQVTFAGGYNFGMRTRATANISYGQMTQNQKFIPYSSVFPTVIPLPRNSLDGKIETIFINLDLSTRLTNRLGLIARYTFDDRNNKTPQDIYVRIPGDAAAQGTLLSEDARVNWPYSLRHHKLQVDANYNFMQGARVTVGYQFDRKNRNYTEVEHTDEHTGKIRLSFNPFSSAGGWIRYEHSMRRGSSYISNVPLLTGHGPEYIADITLNDPGELYENDPLMRKFHIADRNRDQLAAAVNYYPNDELTFTLSGRYNRDDFLHTQDGLQESKNGDVTLDGGFTPNEKISFNAYVTYENYEYKQRGFYHPGFAGDLTPTTDRIAVFGDNWWTQDHNDNIYTGGAGFDWNVIKDKLKVKADFLASHAITKIKPNSTGLAFLPLPDLKTDFYQFNVTAEYNIKENMGVRFRYLYENFDTSDFARDLVGPATLSNVILLGNATPNYGVHVVGLSYFYKWQ